MDSKQVRRYVVSCKLCDLHRQCTAPVPFRGPPDARIAIMGEAPGKDEDRERKPFVGQAGKLLEQRLREVGIDIDDCFIFNTVQCWPHGAPPDYAVEACKPNRAIQLRLTEATHILVLGNVALRVLKPDANITKERGKYFERKGRLWFPTMHPAGALRNIKYMNWLKQDLWDFKVLLKQEKL